MLDDSAERRFGPFAVGDYREFQGRRLKIIGRTRDARSFTTNPIAFLDYRLAQSLSPDELGGRTTFIIVKLEPWADPAAVRAEIRRRLPYNDVHTKAEWACDLAAILDREHRAGADDLPDRLPGRAGRAWSSWPRRSTPRRPSTWPSSARSRPWAAATSTSTG